MFSTNTILNRNSDSTFHVRIFVGRFTRLILRTFYLALNLPYFIQFNVNQFIETGAVELFVLVRIVIVFHERESNQPGENCAKNQASNKSNDGFPLCGGRTDSV